MSERASLREENVRLIPSIRSWRHRDGGRVVQVYGSLWTFECWWAIRHRDRYGVRQPFGASLRLYGAST